MRAVAAVLVFVAAAMTSTSAADGQRRDVQPGRDGAIEALVLDARAAAPEFAADIMLRLAASERVASQNLKRDLVEDAYLRAYIAAESYRRAAMDAPPDTRQGSIAVASDTGLTRVSLQLRAVQQMAFIDPPRARELFDWIDLDLVQGSCDSPLVPVVDEYYSTLATVARTTFPATVDGRNDALRFLTLYLFRAHLPSEMPSVARTLRRFRPTREEALYLDSTFRWILESSFSDPRGFSGSSLDLIARMSELEDGDRDLGLTNWTVTRMLRDYLVAQLKGSRCSDSQTDGTAIDTFNAELRRREILPEQLAPLSATDTRPSRMLGAAKLDRYWQTPDARRLFATAMQLRGPDRNPTPLQVRQSEQWQTQAAHLLADIDQWSGAREASERDMLYQKSALYTVLVDLVPRSALRLRTIRSFIGFLGHAERDRALRALWFAFVSRVLELTHSEDRKEVLEALEQSRHPVLALYARLERTLGAPDVPRRRSDF
jgi:hypothetical protein